MFNSHALNTVVRCQKHCGCRAGGEGPNGPKRLSTDLWEKWFLFQQNIWSKGLTNKSKGLTNKSKGLTNKSKGLTNKTGDKLAT